MNKLTLLLCLLLFGCETKENDFIEAVQTPAFVSYLGSDINGELRECSAEPTGEICTSEYGPGDAFADECRDRGFEAFSCGCHDYICLDREIQHGWDIDGNPRSCEEMSPDIACSMEFTPEDQFAMDCRASGKEAIRCGCHDYICK